MVSDFLKKENYPCKRVFKTDSPQFSKKTSHKVQKCVKTMTALAQIIANKLTKITNQAIKVHMIVFTTAIMLQFGS